MAKEGITLTLILSHRRERKEINAPCGSYETGSACLPRSWHRVGRCRGRAHRCALLGNKDTRVLVSQQSYLVHHGGYAGDRGGLCPEYARSEAHRKDTKGASVFDFGGGKPTLRTDDYIDTGYRASQSTKDAPKARATLLFPWNNRRLGDRLTCGPEIDALHC